MKTKPPKWLYLPLVAIMLLISALPLHEFRKARYAADEINLKNIPLLAFEKLWDEQIKMRKEVFANGTPQDPSAYFRYTTQIKEWYLKVKKFEHCMKAEPTSRFDTLERMNIALYEFMKAQKESYDTVFGQARMQSVADEYWKTHKEDPGSKIPSDYTAFWAACRLVYWPLVVVWAIGILPLWLTRREMKVWYEIPRIIFASLTFFASWLVYPVRLDQTRQVKSALEFACYILTLLFSFGAAGGSIVKAQSSPLRIKTKYGQVEREKRHGALTLTTGVSSQAASGMSGGILSEHPSFQSTARLTFEGSGSYVFTTQYMGMDDRDPASNSGDWLVGGIGYTGKIGGKFTGTAEVSIMSAPPFRDLGGDYFILRGTLAQKGHFGTLSGTVRQTWKITGGGAESGTFGYLGYNRGIKIADLPVMVSSELKLDSGNFGKGAAIVPIGRVELSLPWKLRCLKPFVEIRGPVWKENHKKDPRSVEFLGGFNLSWSFSF